MAHLKDPDRIAEEVSLVSERMGTSLIPPSRNGSAKDLVEDPDVSTTYAVRREAFSEGLRSLRDGEESLSISEAKKARFIEALNRLDRYVESQSKGIDPVLRDHQVDVFEDLRNALEEGIRTGYIKLPTGSGKTVIFVELAEVLGLKTLIVVPTQELIDQTTKQLAKHAPNLDVAQIYGKRKQEIAQCNLTSYAYLIRAMQSGKWKADDFDFVILDEAHLGLGKESQSAIETLAEHAIVLGFTATPEYNEYKSLDSLLGPCIHKLTALEAIQRGILAPVSNLVVRVDVDLSAVKINSSGQYDDQELEQALMAARSIQTAIKLCQDLFSDRKMIVRCGGVDHAVQIAESLKAAGSKAESISGDDPKRSEKLESFRKNDLRILCNDKLLTAGFDDPETSVVINLVPNYSKVVAEQIGGRALRLDPADPNKHAVVVDVLYKDTRPGAPIVLFNHILEGRAVVSATEESDSLTQPSWLVERCAKLTIDGVEVALDLETMHRFLPDQQRDELDTAPEGWRTKAALAQHIKSSSAKIDSALEGLKDEFEQHKKYFRTASGRVAQHYSPELCQKIEDLCRPIPLAPPGWKHATAIKRELLLEHSTVEAIAQEYKAEHPEWFAHFRVPKYNLGPPLHYHPDLVQIIRNRVGEPIPDNWESISKLTSSSGWRGAIERDIAEKVVSESPDSEKGVFRTSETVRGMCVSPKVAQSIRDNTEQSICEKTSFNYLAERLGCSVNEIRLAADYIFKRENREQAGDQRTAKSSFFREFFGGTPRETQPAIKTYRSPNDEKFDYIDQSQVGKLTSSICSKIEAPGEWKTITGLYASLTESLGRVNKHGFQESRLRAKLSNIGPEFPPDHIREYINTRSRMPDTYLSPELQAAIIKSMETQTT